tara:strand:+ start:63 stop:1058 length:996 start_codon:yes stop_codon:yes gene_type:complete
VSLAKFGYIKTRTSKPKIIYCKSIFYVSKFLWKNIFLPYDVEKDQILKEWYINKYLEKFTLKKIFNFKSIYFNPFLFKSFRKFFFSFFRHDTINLKKNDILILGPYANNHFHIINDFILRILLLEKKNIGTIYLPKSCQKYIEVLNIKKVFNFKFFYLENNKNYEFKNASYLTHLETRTNNFYYKSCVKKLKKIIKVKRVQNKFNILISREKNSRKILNEDNLFKELKKRNFIKLNFENLSLAKQIFYCLNSRVIIGYHGSGIINPILFGNEKIHIIEILHKEYNHKMYEKICKTIKLNYKSFICDGDKKTLNCFCNIKEIVGYIEKFMRV